MVGGHAVIGIDDEVVAMAAADALAFSPVRMIGGQFVMRMDKTIGGVDAPQPPGP